MKRRHPGTFAAVSAAHAALAWALLSLGPVQSSATSRTGPQAEARLVSVVLHPAPRPADLAPTAPKARPQKATKAAAPRAGPSERERPADAVRAQPAPAHASPAMADAIDIRDVPIESQRVGASPADRTAAALAAAPDPAPPAPTVAPARSEPPPVVVAHADRRLCPPAPHPAALRERGIEGALVLRVKVDMQGRPADVQVLAGSGWRLFDEAALQQVRACRFIPATQGGQAIDSWVEFPVRFALAG